MSTFHKIADKEKYFFYRRGNVSTKRVWGRPTYDRMKSFFQKVNSETKIMDEYELYLIGGVLFSFNTTWDVDICMTGKIKNYRELEMYMDKMYDISLNEFGMLIDIQWLEIPLPDISFDEFVSPDFRNYTLKYIATTSITKQIGNEISHADLRNQENVKALTEFLVEGIHDEYPKNKKKIVDFILGYPNRIYRGNMNVIEFLENEEEYFLKNTNRV